MLQGLSTFHAYSSISATLVFGPLAHTEHPVYFLRRQFYRSLRNRNLGCARLGGSVSFTRDFLLPLLTIHPITWMRTNQTIFRCDRLPPEFRSYAWFKVVICIVGHINDDPFFHKKYTEAGVMAFVAHCTRAGAFCLSARQEAGDQRSLKPAHIQK